MFSLVEGALGTFTQQLLTNELLLVLESEVEFPT